MNASNGSPAELVKRGVVQVMAGRHCFAHLTIEENLLTGAYTRKLGRGDIDAALERVYQYFPRLKQRRTSQAGYTSGGEQQMTGHRPRIDGQTHHDPARRKAVHEFAA